MLFNGNDIPIIVTLSMDAERRYRITEIIHRSDVEELKLMSDLDVIIADNNFAFHALARSDTMIKFFLENGSNPDPVDNYGVTPLMLYCGVTAMPADDLIPSIKLLIDGKADVNWRASTNFRKTPLDAAMANSPKIVELLLDNGAKIDDETLHDSCAFVDSLCLLLDRKADVDSVFRGKSLLKRTLEYQRGCSFLSDESPYIPCIGLLLDYGADPRGIEFDNYRRRDYTVIPKNAIELKNFIDNYHRPKLSARMLRKYEIEQWFCILILSKCPESIMFIIPNELINYIIAELVGMFI